MTKICLKNGEILGKIVTLNIHKINYILQHLNKKEKNFTIISSTDKTFFVFGIITPTLKTD